MVGQGVWATLKELFAWFDELHDSRSGIDRKHPLASCVAIVCWQFFQERVGPD